MDIRRNSIAFLCAATPSATAHVTTGTANSSPISHSSHVITQVLPPWARGLNQGNANVSQFTQHSRRAAYRSFGVLIGVLSDARQPL